MFCGIKISSFIAKSNCYLSCRVSKSREHALKARQAVRIIKDQIKQSEENQKFVQEELSLVNTFLTYTSLTEGLRRWFLERKAMLENILVLIKEELEVEKLRLANWEERLRIYSIS